MRCAITSKATGSQVSLSSPSGETSYSTGGRSGKSILMFGVAQPGTYELACNYEGQSGQSVVLAVGNDATGKIWGTVLSGLAIAFGTTIASIAIAATTFFRRRKAKKQLTSSL